MTETTDSQTIIQLAQGHLSILIGRNWEAISELLSESEEVTVSAKIVITERTPEAGEHSDVDHRVKTTISFSKKVSDSTESALEDPSNAPLTCPHGKTLDAYCDECSGGVFSGKEPEPVNPERFPETGDSARDVQEAAAVIQDAAQPIGTSIADKLAQAAQGVDLAPVVIDFPEGFTGDKYRALWRKAAKKQGWPFACIDLIDDIAETTALDNTAPTDAAQRVLDVLKAHSIDAATHEEAAERAKRLDENERLAGTFGETE